MPIIDRLTAIGHTCVLFTNWTYVDDADVYWFDFCDNNLIAATRDDKEHLKTKKVIARLHAIEYYMNFHQQIDWSVVDHLIFVSEHLKRLCGELHIPTSVIHNGIDLDKLEWKKRSQGKVIGYAGNIVRDKGILTMFHYFGELMNHDSAYRLKMVGLKRFGGREGEYYQHYLNVAGIRDKVEEADEVSDINEWLDSIDYLWQPSYAESFSLIVGEAMAKGIKPIINDFYGSKELWPEDLVYHDFDGFYRILKDPYESARYRSYVERYSLDNQMEKILALL